MFGTAHNKPDMLGNLTKRLLIPMQLAAGVAEPVLDAEGKPVLEPVLRRGKAVLVGAKPQMRPKTRAKYGWHSFRHYAVSVWLATGIDPKTSQHWAGHSSLMITLDTYGHFIPRADDHARIAAAERALLA